MPRRLLVILIAVTLLAVTARAAEAPKIKPKETPFDPIAWTITQTIQRVGGEDLTEHIIAAGEQTGIDPLLLAALIWKESDFRCNVPGKSGELGPCQLMPYNAARLGINPTDPAEGTLGGALYLAEKLTWCKDLNEALRVYNGGVGKKDGKRARTYAQWILRRYSQLKHQAEIASCAL